MTRQVTTTDDLSTILDRADKPSVDMETMEGEVRNLIQGHFDKVRPADRSRVIAGHAKMILQNATSATREMLTELGDAIADLDQEIARNEQRLLGEIDEHISLANDSAKAARIIRDSIGQWSMREKRNRE